MPYICDNVLCKYHVPLKHNEEPSVWVQQEGCYPMPIIRHLWMVAGGEHHLCDGCHRSAAGNHWENITLTEPTMIERVAQAFSNHDAEVLPPALIRDADRKT